MVPEGGAAKLVCRARGYPPPKILWRREDGGDIISRGGPQGKMKGSCSFYIFCSENVKLILRQGHPHSIIHLKILSTNATFNFSLGKLNVGLFNGISQLSYENSYAIQAQLIKVMNFTLSQGETTRIHNTHNIGNTAFPRQIITENYVGFVPSIFLYDFRLLIFPDLVKAIAL